LRSDSRRTATDPSYAPGEFLAADGKTVQGFEVDLSTRSPQIRRQDRVGAGQVPQHYRWSQRQRTKTFRPPCQHGAEAEVAHEVELAKVLEEIVD
jgi:hypothetical protein